ESAGCSGLGLLKGRVVRFQAAKVPQIGWNLIEPQQNGGWQAGHVYFVNSYFPQPAQPEVMLYQAEYGVPFCAAVRTNNITAFQFHPEKSGQFGGQLLERWIDDVSRS